MSFCGRLAALEMIKYSMDELGAVGIAVSSCYGNGSDASELLRYFFQMPVHFLLL